MSVRIRNGIRAFDIPYYIERFISIEKKALTKRLRVLKAHMIDNEFFNYWCQKHHCIELELASLLKNTNYQNIKLEDYYRSLSFIYKFIELHDQIHACSQTRLKGMLRDGLNKNTGLASLETELSVIFHLCSRNHTVITNDLDGKKPAFDFIAQKENLDIEIECKLITSDLGRKIPLYNHIRLSNQIVRKLNNNAILESKIIKVTLNDRLPDSEYTLIELANNISDLVKNKCTHFENETYKIEQHKAPQSPQIVLQKTVLYRHFEEIITNEFGRPDANAIIIGRQRGPHLIIGIQSKLEDKIAERIEDVIKDAGKQFSKTRPAVVVVRLHEISSASLISLCASQNKDNTPNALQIIATKILCQERFNHIASIVFISGASEPSTENIFFSTKHTSNGSAYSIANPNNHNGKIGSEIFSDQSGIILL